MGIAAGGSVNTIGGIIRRDQAGFLAGALAGLASESGWVGRIDGTGGEAATETIYQASFTHGLRYACPRCRLMTAAAQLHLSRQKIVADGLDVYLDKLAAEDLAGCRCLKAKN